MPITALMCGIACKLALLIHGLPVWLLVALAAAYGVFTIAGVTGLILVLVFDDLMDLLEVFGGGRGGRS